MCETGTVVFFDGGEGVHADVAVESGGWEKVVTSYIPAQVVERVVNERDGDRIFDAVEKEYPFLSRRVHHLKKKYRMEVGDVFSSVACAAVRENDLVVIGGDFHQTNEKPFAYMSAFSACTLYGCEEAVLPPPPNGDLRHFVEPLSALAQYLPYEARNTALRRLKRIYVFVHSSLDIDKLVTEHSAVGEITQRGHELVLCTGECTVGDCLDVANGKSAVLLSSQGSQLLGAVRQSPIDIVDTRNMLELELELRARTKPVHIPPVPTPGEIPTPQWGIADTVRLTDPSTWYPALAWLDQVPLEERRDHLRKVFDALFRDETIHSWQIRPLIHAFIGIPAPDIPEIDEGTRDLFPRDTPPPAPVIDEAEFYYIRQRLYNRMQFPSPSGEGLKLTKLVPVPSTLSNVAKLCRALQHPVPLLVEGATGLGKTATVMAAGEQLGMKVVRFNLSGGTSTDDLVGSLQLDHTGSIVLSETPFTRAYEHGHLLVLDEANLAQEEVLSLVEVALDTDGHTSFSPSPPLGHRCIRRHENFRLVITQNPSRGMYSGKRATLSAAFLSRFQRICISPPTPAELTTIAERVAGAGKSDAVRCVIDAFLHDTPASASLRDILHCAQRLKAGVPVQEACYVVFGAKHLDSDLRLQVAKRVGYTPVSSPPARTSPLPSLVPTDRVRRLWNLMDIAGSTRPILVVGSVGCGKTMAVQGYAGEGAVVLYLNSDTECGALVGQHLPSNGTVRWHDGPVPTAMKEGKCLILDNLTDATAEVLERLNPVLECPPSLLLTEHDASPVAVHPNFRVIATATDSKINDLSPALLNRFCVIAMDPFPEKDPERTVEIECLVHSCLGETCDATRKEATRMCTKLAEGGQGVRGVIQHLKCTRRIAGQRACTQQDVRRALTTLENTLDPTLETDLSSVAPSLRPAAHKILWCTRLGVPALVVDDYDWDCTGDLLPSERRWERVTATTRTILSDWLGTTLPRQGAKGQIETEFVPGPLHRIEEAKGILLVDDIHQLQTGPLTELLQRVEQAGGGFSVVGKCSRAVDVPEEQRAVFAVVQLPRPMSKDYTYYMGSFTDIDGETRTRIAQQAQDMERPFLMSPSRFRRVRKRVKQLAAHHPPSVGWPLCFAMEARHHNVASFAAMGREEERESLTKYQQESPSITLDHEHLVFTGWGLRCTFPRGADPMPSYPDAARAAIVAVAHATAAGEGLVLYGPSGCKSWAVSEFGRLVGVEVQEIHLTCGTEHADLVGGIQPFTPNELSAYMSLNEELLRKRCNGGTAHGFESWHRSIESMRQEAGRQGTLFKFRDGPLSLAVKRGRGLVFESAGVADVGLIEELRELLLSRRVVAGSATIPLRETSPLVLIVTCREGAKLPPHLSRLTYFEADSYSPHDILNIACQVSGAPLEIAQLISKLAPFVSLRTMQRWCHFVRYYTDFGWNSKGAVLLGAKYLFLCNRDPEDLRKTVGEKVRCMLKAFEFTESLIAESETEDEHRLSQFVSIRNGHVELLHRPASKDAKGVVLARGKHHGSERVAFDRIEGMSHVTPTKTLRGNLVRVVAAATLRIPLLLEGEPGIGKGYVVQQAAAMLGAVFLRLQLSSGTTLSSLFGSVLPRIEGGQRVFNFQEGRLVKAIKDSHAAGNALWILLDELNLAPPDVQQALSPLFEGGTFFSPLRDEALPISHVKIFAAINPLAVGGGRSHLPPSVRDLFTPLYLSPLKDEEELAIAKGKILRKGWLVTRDMLVAIEYVHLSLKQAVREGVVGVGEHALINLRTLEKVALLLEAQRESTPSKEYLLQVLEVVYKWGFASRADQGVVEAILSEAAAAMHCARTEWTVTALGNRVRFGAASCIRNTGYWEPRANLLPTPHVEHALVAIATASASSVAVLVEGASGTGKTLLVKELARITGQHLHVVSVSPSTEAGDFLGMWVPCTPNSDDQEIRLEVMRLFLASNVVFGSDDRVAELFRTALDSKESARQLCRIIEESDKVKRQAARRLAQLLEPTTQVAFHFVDSVLLRAITYGEWVLLDNIDWAPPSAIERLNSLLESEPTLRVDEKGGSEPLLEKGGGIHPNFRLFLTANPEREHAFPLSAAFYNRVIRVVLPSPEPGDTSFLAAQLGAPEVLRYVAARFHSLLCETVGKSLNPRLVVHPVALADTLRSLSQCLLDQYEQYASPSDLMACLRGAVSEAQVKYASDQGSEGSFCLSSWGTDEVPSEEDPDVGDEAEDDPVVEPVPKGTGTEYEGAMSAFGRPKPLRLKEFGVSDGYFSCTHETLQELGMSLAHMWRNKGGGVVEELIANLRAPPGTDKRELLHKLCTDIAGPLQQKYPTLSPIHLLVLKLYSSEGPDVDRAMLYENVPVWREDNEEGAEEAQQQWKSYKAQVGSTRNPEIYKVVNRALRDAAGGDSVKQAEAQATLRKWVKFIGVLMGLHSTMSSGTTVYRGINGLSEDQIALHRQWKKGELVGWPSPSSMSKVENQLKFFVREPESSVKFEVRNVLCGIDMGPISLYPQEEEVLLPPLSVLCVEGVVSAPGKPLFVQLSFRGVLGELDAHLRYFLDQVLSDATDAMWRLHGLHTEDARFMELDPSSLPFDRVLDEPSPSVVEVNATNDFFGGDGPPLPQTSSLLSLTRSILDRYLGDPSIRSKAISSWAWWERLTLELRGSILATSEALGGFLPFNVFTRPKPSSKGAVLHIPGLIRAITTNFAYAKVFAAKQGGGRRSYSVVIVVNGDDPDRVYERVRLFVTLIGGLQGVGVESSVLVYYESDIYCVKTADDSWDHLSAYTIRTHINLHRQKKDRPEQTDRTAVLRAAVTLAKEQRGKKKLVFMLAAKGAPWSNPKVAGTLASAAAANVDVVGVGLETSIHTAFPRAISVPRVQQLAQGIEYLHQGPHRHPRVIVGGSLVPGNAQMTRTVHVEVPSDTPAESTAPSVLSEALTSSSFHDKVVLAAESPSPALASALRAVRSVILNDPDATATPRELLRLMKSLDVAKLGESQVDAALRYTSQKDAMTTEVERFFDEWLERVRHQVAQRQQQPGVKIPEGETKGSAPKASHPRDRSVSMSSTGSDTNASEDSQSIYSQFSDPAEYMAVPTKPMKEPLEEEGEETMWKAPEVGRTALPKRTFMEPQEEEEKEDVEGEAFPQTQRRASVADMKSLKPQAALWREKLPMEPEGGLEDDDDDDFSEKATKVHRSKKKKEKAVLSSGATREAEERRQFDARYEPMPEDIDVLGVDDMTTVERSRIFTPERLTRAAVDTSKRRGAALKKRATNLLESSMSGSMPSMPEHVTEEKEKATGMAQAMLTKAKSLPSEAFKKAVRKRKDSGRSESTPEVKPMSRPKAMSKKPQPTREQKKLEKLPLEADEGDDFVDVEAELYTRREKKKMTISGGAASAPAPPPAPKASPEPSASSAKAPSRSWKNQAPQPRGSQPHFAVPTESSQGKKKVERKGEPDPRHKGTTKTAKEDPKKTSRTETVSRVPTQSKVHLYGSHTLTPPRLAEHPGKPLVPEASSQSQRVHAGGSGGSAGGDDGGAGGSTGSSSTFTHARSSHAAPWRPLSVTSSTTEPASRALAPGPATEVPGALTSTALTKSEPLSRAPWEGPSEIRSSLAHDTLTRAKRLAASSLSSSLSHGDMEVPEVGKSGATSSSMPLPRDPGETQVPNEEASSRWKSAYNMLTRAKQEALSEDSHMMRSEEMDVPTSSRSSVAAAPSYEPQPDFDEEVPLSPMQRGQLETMRKKLRTQQLSKQQNVCTNKDAAFKKKDCTIS